jgi:hypothetical protein
MFEITSIVGFEDHKHNLSRLPEMVGMIRHAVDEMISIAF